MTSNGSFEEFECVLSNDNHFVEEPITLPCGHYTCIKCIHDKPNTTPFKCRNCKLEFQTDKITQNQSKTLIESISCKVENLIIVIQNKLTQSVENFKSKPVFIL